MEPTASGHYPEDWETDAALADGATVRIRPIRSDDRDRLAQFHNRQSPESIYFRFFRHRPQLSEQELDYFTNIDYQRRMAFVALLGDQIVAVARYETLKERNVAEVAFFVDDAHHGRGLATLMLEYLASAGRRRQLDGFVATVLSENYGMLRVFRRAGFAVSTAFEDGAIAVTLGIDITEETSAAIEERARVAEARSVARILEATSVVVIGAGRRPDSVGHQLLRNLLASPFAGELHVVHPSASVIAGRPTVPDVASIGERVDLAVIAVPATAVFDVVQQCIQLGVGGLVIISAGFSETGLDGTVRERELVALARGNGVRLVGPNAFGIANTSPDSGLQILFLPVSILPGSVGLLSQSGPLGGALLSHFAGSGIGISTFAAVGNRADVSVNDLLSYWSEDARTTVVALYLDNLGNVPKFTRMARVVSQHKPIVAVAPHDEELRELLRQSGVILVDQVAELADQVGLAVRQPVPDGDRVVVISNSSSVARLASSACRAAGLTPTVPTIATGGGFLTDESVLVSDTDNLTMGPEAAIEAVERLVLEAAGSTDVDVVFLALVPTPTLPIVDIVALLQRVDERLDKPMVATGLTGIRPMSSVSVFGFPEEAARALGRWVSHGIWRGQDRGPDIVPHEPDALVSVVADLLAGSTETDLANPLVQRFLETLGVEMAPMMVASSRDDARRAAEALGYPVVLKAGGRTDRVVGERGGTALDLHDSDELTAAYERMSARSDFLPAIVQPMAELGVHLEIRLEHDRSRGARMTFGPARGGVGDRAHQVLPVGSDELHRLVESPVVRSWLGERADRDALRSLLAALAGAASHDEIRRVELQPVLVQRGRAIAVEASVQVGAVQARPLDDVRHL